MPLVTCAEPLIDDDVAPLVCPASATFWVPPPNAEHPAAANAAATASVPDRRGSARGRNLPRMSPAHAAARPGVRLSAMFMRRPFRLALMPQAPRPRPPWPVRVLPGPSLTTPRPAAPAPCDRLRST